MRVRNELRMSTENRIVAEETFQPKIKSNCFEDILLPLQKIQTSQETTKEKDKNTGVQLSAFHMTA